MVAIRILVLDFVQAGKPLGVVQGNIEGQPRLNHVFKVRVDDAPAAVRPWSAGHESVAGDQRVRLRFLHDGLHC